jgi:hypothetical protein
MLAEDEGTARGSSAEHVTVRFESQLRNCRGYARVLDVQQGERFRAGDRIEFTQPCVGAGGREGNVARAFGASRTGTSARVYVGFDGGLRYLAPL